jgi:hypothetical protein
MYLHHVIKQLKDMSIGDSKVVDLKGKEVKDFRMSMSTVRGERRFKSYALPNGELTVVRVY